MDWFFSSLLVILFFFLVYHNFWSNSLHCDFYLFGWSICLYFYKFLRLILDSGYLETVSRFPLQIFVLGRGRTALIYGDFFSTSKIRPDCVHCPVHHELGGFPVWLVETGTIPNSVFAFGTISLSGPSFLSLGCIPLTHAQYSTGTLCRPPGSFSVHLSPSGTLCSKVQRLRLPDLSSPTLNTVFLVPPGPLLPVV